MLYLSTRNSTDAYTAYKTLTESECPDGGRYIPFRLPAFTDSEILALREKTLSETIADILNLFFSSRLTAWDVESCIGRNPIKLVFMNHKILIAELWHNLQGKYSYLVDNLYRVVLTGDNTDCSPTDWFRIAVRIAILFGIYGEMLKNEQISALECFDIAVSTGDFSAPMAVWYAREMGLPVETIICTDEESSLVWDWIHRGTFNPIGASAELISGIERLVCATQGTALVDAYLSKVQSGRIYSVDSENLPMINKGLFSCVAGLDRADSVINSVFRTNQYVITPDAALCFGGLQDYRSKTGESRTTVILSENTPLDHIQKISAATGITAEKLTLNLERL